MVLVFVFVKLKAQISLITFFSDMKLDIERFFIQFESQVKERIESKF